MAQSLAQVLVNEQPLQEMVPPEQSIGYQVRRLNQDMTDIMARFVGRHGISGPHWGYLRHIYFDDGLSQRELSDRMARQGATTVTALRRLEKAGFVTSRSHETDQRKNSIYLTDKGRKLVIELMPYVREVENIAFSSFGEKEVAQFWKLLDRMRGNFEASKNRRLPVMK
jgi:DNA-binding MarR family transcriptional regulator